jgi:tryptophanyl-tRNA synthetase
MTEDKPGYVGVPNGIKRLQHTTYGEATFSTQQEIVAELNRLQTLTEHYRLDMHALQTRAECDEYIKAKAWELFLAYRSCGVDVKSSTIFNECLVEARKIWGK